MFNFWTTQTQNKSVTDDDYHLTFADDWKKLVQNEMTCWRDFHKLWIDLSAQHPVLFFRFEDLTADPESVLSEVYRFVLDLKPEDLEGTVL
jgi:hypothetical protein